jgi:hypothetical protein
MDTAASTLQHDGLAERERVLRILRQQEPTLRARGVTRLRLFGSMARGEAGPDSDVDASESSADRPADPSAAWQLSPRPSRQPSRTGNSWIASIPDTLKDRYPTVRWPSVAAVGNVLRHGYEAVDEREFWRIVQRDLPELRVVVERMYGEIDAGKAESEP